jgi:hypothetical protein
LRARSAEEIGRSVDLLDGFLDVEDVDLVLGAHDELLHLGVPALGLVTEMDSGFDEFGEDRCGHVLFEGACLPHAV